MGFDSQFQICTRFAPDPAMLAPVRSAARPSVRSFAASPWGTDHWRHDKQAFKAWAQASVEPGTSKEKRELYGFLALSFGDVDTDKDGLINAEQFDQLLAEVAALPRRYGLAPLDVGDAVSRAVNHKILFDTLDTKNGPARGVLGLDQFIEWAYDHVVTHVPKVPAKDVGLYHVEDYSEEEYIGFVEKAVNNPGSYEHASFYNFILNCFVEADEQCQGRIPTTSSTSFCLVPPLCLATSAWPLQSPPLRPARKCSTSWSSSAVAKAQAT